MNNPLFKRGLHAAVAGVIAVSSYYVVIYLSITRHFGWNFYENNQCGIIASLAVCLLYGLTAVFNMVIIFGIPLALFLSAAYLKLAKFSWSSAILIPLISNVVAIILFTLGAWRLSYDKLLPATWLGLPLLYLLFGLAIRSRRLKVAQNGR